MNLNKPFFTPNPLKGADSKAEYNPPLGGRGVKLKAQNKIKNKYNFNS
jgi:hypothetical protein